MKNKLKIALISLMGAIVVNAYAGTNEIWPGFTTTASDADAANQEFSAYLFGKTEYINNWKSKFGDQELKPSKDYFKSENAVLVYIETSILKDLFQTNAEEKLKEEKIKDLLAVRQYRYEKVLSEEDKKYENGIDANTGILEYVDSRVTQIDEFELADKHQYCTLSNIDYQSKSSVIDCIETSPAEFVAVAAGYQLDKLDPQGTWKSDAEKNLQSPVDLLQSYYQKLNNEELLARIEKVKASYHYDDLLQKFNSILDMGNTVG